MTPADADTWEFHLALTKKALDLYQEARILLRFGTAGLALEAADRTLHLLRDIDVDAAWGLEQAVSILTSSASATSS